MKCDRCKKTDATVHLKQIVGEQVLSLNLCLACADAEGIGDKLGSELNVLAVLEVIAQKAGKVLATHAENAVISPRTVCERCGTSNEELEKNGLLGCPECYQTFKGQLAAMFGEIHRDSLHRGRGIATPVNAMGTPLLSKVAHLEEELSRAVATEAYEDAAHLRDRIFALRQDVKK